MSMPEFPMPNPDMTQEQALIMILSSIALEELALSHIINAEGEKIQYAINSPITQGHPATIPEVLAINQSVTTLLEMVMQNQLLLKNKMTKVLEFLPKPPPCPIPPCPPLNPYSGRQKSPCICFQALSGAYKTCSEIQWHTNVPCDNFCINAADKHKILIPRTGSFSADLSIEVCNSFVPESLVCLELKIDCGDKGRISKLLYHKMSRLRTIFSDNIAIQMPCACSACYASLVIRSADCLQIKQGFISFTSKPY